VYQRQYSGNRYPQGAQQVSIQSKADAALYLILTPDQQAKMPEVRGPGGPGFGPPPGGRGVERFRGR